LAGRLFLILNGNVFDIFAACPFLIGPSGRFQDCPGLIPGLILLCSDRGEEGLRARLESLLHMSCTHALTAILPCNDLNASEAFYAKLGFLRQAGGDESYRMLSDGKGGAIHLTDAVEGWLVPGRNPFGLYLYAENVDELARKLGEAVLHPAENKPWGMYEFSLSGPDETLVRVGWPTRLRNKD
jgi:hypothetical protein